MSEKKNKKPPEKKSAETQDESEFDDTMEIAERVMAEERELLRKLAKS